MRGALARIRQLAVALLVCAALILSGCSPMPAHAAGFLENPKDIVSTTAPGAVDVYHDVSFILPADAQPVTTRDYVEVSMPTFGQVRPFTEMVNGFGTPVFSESNNVIYTTGVSIPPGSEIGLIGALADNPPAGVSIQVTIRIVKGSPNGVVSNEASIDAGFNGAYLFVTAFIQSPLAALSISGYTAPSSFVSLTENDAVVGTTTSLSDGSFILALNGLDTGPHTYHVYSTDPNHLQTSQSVIDTYLYTSTSTSFTNILLSPTITVDKTSIDQGQTLTLSGTGKPNSQITLTTESPAIPYSLTTDANGVWSRTLSGSETAAYAPGQHTGYAILQDDQGNSSLRSPTVNFTITVPNTGNDPPPACDISHGDLNCDGHVNLRDFSILLSFWGQHSNVRKYDINRDGKIDLKDFSIMLFYFGT